MPISPLSHPMPFGVDFDPDSALRAALEQVASSPCLWGALTLGATGRCSRKEVSDWGPNSTSWSCRVSTPLGRLSSGYSQGASHGGASPEVFDLLRSLALDASLTDDCSDAESMVRSGYVPGDPSDPETWKTASKMFKACTAAGAKLKRVFGPFMEAQDAGEAARAAFDMRLSSPWIDEIAPDKPFGALELAAMSDPELLEALLSERAYPADRLARARALAEGWDEERPDGGAIFDSVAERVALRGLVGVPDHGARPRAL